MTASITKLGIPAAVVTSALVLLAPMLAFAANPHFVGTPTINKTISGNTATLTVNGKVAGLGNEPVTLQLTTSGVTVQTACENKGGHNPPGQTATFGPTSGQTQTIQPRNGQISFKNAAPLTVTITAAQAGCPDGMKPLITSATFSNVQLTLYQGTGTTGPILLQYNFGTVDP